MNEIIIIQYFLTCRRADAKLFGNRLTRATKRHKTCCLIPEKLQKIKKAAASLRHPRKTTALPRRREEGRVGGREREREREGGREGRKLWLDDRMAAFTQRVVSPAETHFTIQHNRAIFRSHLQFISTPARSAPRFRHFGFVLFCLLLYFDATCLGTLPCPLRMDRVCQSRRTKRIKPLQRTVSPQKSRIFVCKYSG